MDADGRGGQIELFMPEKPIPMEISKYVWTTATRPCRFCLCLHGGSVFADFNIDSDGRVYLVRISFDGYGCCATEGKVVRMSLHDSQTLVKLVDTDDLNRDEIPEILYRYFNQNQNVIWQDALLEHQLLGVTEK
jgi:hypothetical protein